MSASHRRQFLWATAWLGFAGTGSLAWAQSQHATIAVPFYRPLDCVLGLYKHWAPQRVQAWVDCTEQLHSALQHLHRTPAPQASPAQARAAWLQALNAWEPLATVPLAPLIQRRSIRQVDFAPTRPALIQRAIERAPTGASAMQLVGTPAKGLPALEWLLWAQPLKPGSPASAYAVEVAAELTREALALQAAFQKAANDEWNEASADAAWAEFINQWIAGLERLRWAQMEKPWREQQTRRTSSKSTNSTSGSATFPRPFSGATAQSWAQQWQVLRELAVSSSELGPVPGQGVVSLESYLRGRGLTALADRWMQRIERSDAAMAQLQTTGMGSGLLLASRELAQTKRLAEADLATALEVSIGFSDADGD